MNRWKVAFFAVLSAWLVSSGALAYLLVDAWVTIGYENDGYGDCRAHRDLLNAAARGRLTRSDFHASAPIVKWSGNGYQRDVQWNELDLKFDGTGRYLGSRFGASATE